MSSACALSWSPSDTVDWVPPDTKSFDVSIRYSPTHGQSAHADSLATGEVAIEDMDARSRITEYLSLRGAEQRNARQSLVNWFKTSRSPHRHIETLVKLVSKGMSEPRLEAAIDLLSLLGGTVIDFAFQAAVSRKYDDSTAAYVLATAAGRIDNSLIWFFRHSPNDACREAVINLVEDLPADEGLPILRQLASDLNPSIRRLAELALNH